MLKVSALTGRNLMHVLPALRQAEEAYHPRVPTASLNRLLQEAQTQHPAPAVKRHRPRDPLRHAGRDRPADVHAVRHPRARHPRTCATSSASIREAFDLGPTPIKLRVRRRNG